MYGHHRAALAVCLLAAFLCPLSSSAQRLTPEQWREDLAALDQAVRTDHKFPFHTVSESAYTSLVTSLGEDIAQLDDQAIIVRMASIVAAVNDGHTRLAGWVRNPEWGFSSYPVGVYWYSDGLFIRQARPDHADLVGARVIRIGKYAVAEAQSLLEQVIAADNQFGKMEGAPYYLISPEVLLALGILDAPDDLPFVLEMDGRQWAPEIEATDDWPGWMRGFVGDTAWAEANDAAVEPTPLWRRHVEKTFWFEYLPDEKILYVQENQVRHAPHETQDQFWARVQDALDANDVDKLVLDLRLNGGGNNYLNRPAVTTMVRADPDVQSFTIIGRRTFSACQNLVNELSRWTNTIFVGEPTGERVNFYGDVKTTELPHSGLRVHASWLWWQNLDPRDTRDALYPDLATDLSSADYARNHDPAMAAIREFEELMTLESAVALVESDGVEAAIQQLRAQIGDPLYRHRELEAEINALGYRMLSRNRPADAIAVFQLNAEEFPDSWNAWDSLGEACETAGRIDEALEHFRKSLELRPDSPTGIAAIERLEGRVTSTQ
jgi:tetratricopeptide (TPR) repeat protein